MSSTQNPTNIDPNDIPTLAPDVVVMRADHDVAEPEQNGRSTAAAKAPPVDTTFRAASSSAAKKPSRTSFGRRLLRGVVGMILTAIVAGAAVLWQSHGDTVKQIFTKSVAPVVVALMSSREKPTADQPSAAADDRVSPVTTATAASAAQSAANNLASSAASASPEQGDLLQSLARELGNLRQDLDQMKVAIAELKATDEQMAREIAKASDKATDKALEQALRPRAAMVSQPVAVPPRKPPPQLARPMQPRAAAVAPQVATSYVPRPADSRAMAPPPSSAAAPPMDISAPRPPAPLREQVP